MLAGFRANGSAMSGESQELPTLATVFEGLQRAAGDVGEASELEVWAKSKELTRDAFFEQAHWAILVANASYETATTWKQKARSTGFPFDWQDLRKWGDEEFDGWCRRMAKTLSSPREDLVGKFRDRWWSIWDLGWWLADFQDGHDFRARVFDGKTHGAELGEDDVLRLAAIWRGGRLRMIGHANRYFVLRNLGGDFLKPDVWVQEFCRWYGDVDERELADSLRQEGISCGRFDAYLWSYCAREIRQASRLGACFDEMFMDGSGATEPVEEETVTVADFEDAVWEIEGIRVVVRDWSGGRIRGYGYERAARESWRVSEFLDKRIGPVADSREVVVVDGGGLRPHGLTLLRNVRASYG